MSARDEMLGRIATALADRPTPAPVNRDYRLALDLDRAAVLDRLVDRLVDYKATVHRVDEAGAPAVIARAVAERGARRVVVPAGFPLELLAELDAEQVSDEPTLATHDLDQLDGVITTCAVAVAETGTIVLDAGAGQGRRALTLVPDYHLILVRAAQVVGNVPEAVALVEPTRPLTWISGPSATSDIELSRVEGVHGPRTLVVVLVD